MFKFEKLTIWKNSMVLGEKTNHIVKEFPMDERFNLKSQMMRSIDSVALNISEGSISQSNRQLRKYISYSIGSLAEFVTCLFKSKLRKYISEQTFKSMYGSSELLMKQLIAFKNSIPPQNK